MKFGNMFLPILLLCFSQFKDIQPMYENCQKAFWFFPQICGIRCFYYDYSGEEQMPCEVVGNEWNEYLQNFMESTSDNVPNDLCKGGICSTRSPNDADNGKSKHTDRNIPNKSTATTTQMTTTPIGTTVPISNAIFTNATATEASRTTSAPNEANATTLAPNEANATTLAPTTAIVTTIVTTPNYIENQTDSFNSNDTAAAANGSVSTTPPPTITTEAPLTINNFTTLESISTETLNNVTAHSSGNTSNENSTTNSGTGHNLTSLNSSTDDSNIADITIANVENLNITTN